MSFFGDSFVEAYASLRQGGWPMIPLLFCSVAGVTVIIERFLALRHHRVLSPHVLHVVQVFEGPSSVDTSLHVCRQEGGAFARIVEEVLNARKVDRAHMIETMQATGRREAGRLERGLTVLEIVAGVSPLIGLLGTVLGMVTVFDAINVQGMGNPQVLSGGISKALITTVAGLCVAIPALAFHSYFSKRVESLAIEMQDLATGFIAKLDAKEEEPAERSATVRYAAQPRRAPRDG